MHLWGLTEANMQRSNPYCSSLKCLRMMKGMFENDEADYLITVVALTYSKYMAIISDSCLSNAN